MLVRFADDVVAMCRSREEAEAALASLRQILRELGLTLKDAKTRIVELRKGARGWTFSASTISGCAQHAQACPVPRPLALTPGDAARPRPHS